MNKQNYIFVILYADEFQVGDDGAPWDTLWLTIFVYFIFQSILHKWYYIMLWHSKRKSDWARYFWNSLIKRNLHPFSYFRLPHHLGQFWTQYFTCYLKCWVMFFSKEVFDPVINVVLPLALFCTQVLIKEIFLARFYNICDKNYGRGRFLQNL